MKMLLLLLLAFTAGAQDYVPQRFRPQVPLDPDKAPSGTLACARNVFMSAEGHAWAAKNAFRTRTYDGNCTKDNEHAQKWPGGWGISLERPVLLDHETDAELENRGYLQFQFVTDSARDRKFLHFMYACGDLRGSGVHVCGDSTGWGLL